VIRGQELFARSVEAAVLAAQEGYVVTLGIAPTGPSTAYGYVRVGEELGLAGAPQVRRVEAFVEKPDQGTAQEYVASGAYRWNAGMFVFQVDTLLGHLARLHPGLHAGLIEIATAWDTPHRTEVMDRVWPTLPRIAIDHAVAEPVAAQGGVATVNSEFAWDDVGDFASLAHVVAPGADGTRLVNLSGQAQAPVVVESAEGTLVVRSSDRAIAVVGIPGAVVVDTADGLLVTTRDQAQRVKDVVARLTRDGAAEYL
jgi:mannose-1-phosphate guanylyltransferase